MAKQTRRMRRKRIRGGTLHEDIKGSYDNTAKWDPDNPNKFISQGKTGIVLLRHQDGSIKVYEWDGKKKVLPPPPPPSPNQGGKTRGKTRRRRYTKK